MGEVDLAFKPVVPVFDANAALGRRHDRRVAVDTPAGMLKEMDRAGIGRALVYHPHAVGYDSTEGNSWLLEIIHGDARFVPQFVCNPAFDDFGAFTSWVKQAAIRSVRMVPALHGYPFRDWVVKRWLDWFTAERIPVWLPTEYQFMGRTSDLDAADVHDTVRAHPDLQVVLSEVHYRHVAWALPMVASLPNVSVEISRFGIGEAVPRLLKIAGGDRVLFGSRFPDSAMSPHLYALHRLGLGNDLLARICAGNLQRLLGLR
jgi:predicted TIM-barrel fold metal-dependent hydrolase